MKITCYTGTPDLLDIRPLGMKREWMDDTQVQFAYRCLPLNIANAHGWALHLKTGFALNWDGGRNPDNLKISSSDPDVSQFALSHFGHGVLTFMLHGLIQTEPGWNLFVGGPPNNIKDGIQPLNGVIETDWSPYNFTMNWKVTRPNMPIIFEKGEPICSFFPVQRGVVENVEAEIRPIEEDPELMAQNNLFKHSRNDFINEKREKMTPEERNATWQKRYFQGRMPDDSPGCPEHQTKLKVPPFVKKGFGGEG